eukprot:1393021-Pleurochrysis_carterae.AAC.1
MHEFLLSKDAEGVVRLHLHKSSQASTWIPEGPGYEVFASDPGSGPPPLAAFKEDQQWQRDTVESTVRRWFPHFAHSSDAARAAA